MPDLLVANTTPEAATSQDHKAMVGSMPRNRSADDPAPYTPMNPLARLIHQRKTELGLSWYDIGKRGEFSSHTIAYALAKKKTHRQPPRAETLRRLAKALDLPLDVVRSAAATAAGYDLHEVPTTLEVAEDARVIVAALNDMSPSDRAKLRRLALALIEDTRTALAGRDETAQDREHEVTESELRAELSDTARKLSESDSPVRSISAKRPRKRS